MRARKFETDGETHSTEDLLPESNQVPRGRVGGTSRDFIEPLWIRVSQAVQLTNLSRSKMYELITAGTIRSASLKDPSQRHATRLIDRADLLAYIERHVKTG